MAKKIIREDDRIKAIRKFTDRDQARDVFWNEAINYITDAVEKMK